MTIFIGLVPPFLSTLQWIKQSIELSNNYDSSEYNNPIYAGEATISTPISFPTEAYLLVTGNGDVAQSSSETISVSAIDKTTLTIWASASANAPANHIDVFVLIIGR